ncbi:MAG: HU family DNA-binding protein [Rickettsiaceae bacterium]|nr:HU family DNA-binding protein [Rickettsiaceae bacterium]
MNKASFISLIADKYNCTKTEAERTIDMFTGSVIEALSKGEEVSLVGFGNFSVSKVASKTGRNPRTGEPIQIPAYKQPKFKVGQKLKDACNNR